MLCGLPKISFDKLSNFVVIYLCLHIESKSKIEKHIIIRYLQEEEGEFHEVHQAMKTVCGERACWH